MTPAATAHKGRTVTPKTPIPPSSKPGTAVPTAPPPVSAAVADAHHTSTPAQTGADTAGAKLTVVITDAADVRKVTMLAATQGISRAEVARRGVHAYVTSQQSVIEAALRDVSTSTAATRPAE